MLGQDNDISFQCSHSCGHGLQTRTVSCHRVNLYGWVDPETTDMTRCSSSQMPLEVRSCDLARCSAGVYWAVGDWGSCQWRGQCGTRGRQRRSVRCVDKAGSRVSRRKCKAEHGNKLRPQRRRKCEKRLCGYTSCEDVRGLGPSTVDCQLLIFLITETEARKTTGSERFLKYSTYFF